MTGYTTRRAATRGGRESMFSIEAQTRDLCPMCEAIAEALPDHATVAKRETAEKIAGICWRGMEGRDRCYRVVPVGPCSLGVAPA